jgi:hypothetical protein
MFGGVLMSKKPVMLNVTDGSDADLVATAVNAVHAVWSGSHHTYLSPIEDLIVRLIRELAQEDQDMEVDSNERLMFISVVDRL